MSEATRGSGRPLESFRSYLRMLANAQLPWHLRGQIDPSDVVQNTLLNAHKAPDQPADGELAAWLRVILKNVIIDAVRRATRERRFVQAVEQSSFRLEQWVAADGFTPVEQAERQEELERLAQALERLPDDQRTAVQLQKIHGYSVAEIVEEMGMGHTKSSVGGLLKRGMRRLRELMREGGDHERA
jgi:RNA polymerase sigma-70 factor (ECF subfamily)